MEEPKTIIADDVEITGNLKCTGGVRLAGRLAGDLVCGGDVLVEKTSQVKGNLTVNTVTVYGRLAGNIVAKDRIELRSGARVTGDIKGKRLIVEDGVSFVGKSEINASGEDVGTGESADSTPAAAELDDSSSQGGTANAANSFRAGRSAPLFARK
ncbi:MAG: polymer-forming cytoskeletal protein [bacterium]